MRRGIAALAATVAVLAVSACGGDEEPSGSGTPQPTEPTAAPTEEPTTQPTAEPEPDVDPTSDDGVIAGFIAARDAFREAYNPPNPEDAGLLAHYAGDALAGTQDELDGLIADGHSEVIEYAHHPEVVLSDPGGAAVVEDCVEAHVRTVDTETGDDVAEPVAETRHTRYTLEFRDDIWVIVQGERLEGACTPGV